MLEQDWFWECCEHCGCEKGNRGGHDDTCIVGCNDVDQVTLFDKINLLADALESVINIKPNDIHLREIVRELRSLNNG